MFLFCFSKVLNQASLHDSHINQFLGFFTFLVSLAHGAPSLEHSTLFDFLRVEITMTHSIETIAFYFEMALTSDKNGFSIFIA